MSGVQPPIDALSSDDIGGLVIVVCFALAAVSLLVGIVHFSLAVRRSLTFGFDDTTYVLANVGGGSSVSVQRITLTFFPQVSAIASTVLWRLAVSNGLGQRMSALTPDSIDKFFKVCPGFCIVTASNCLSLDLAVRICRTAHRNRFNAMRQTVNGTASEPSCTQKAMGQDLDTGGHHGMGNLLYLRVSLPMSASSPLGFPAGSMSDPWQSALSYHHLQCPHRHRPCPWNRTQRLESSNDREGPKRGYDALWTENKVNTIMIAAKLSRRRS